MTELILVKLGGSIITDKSKPFTENLENIKRLANEIHESRKKKNFRLIVGHGGGSFPHSPAKTYRTNEGIVSEKSHEGIAKVQDAASRLNRIIVRELISSGENAVSIHLSSCGIAENGEIKEMFLEPVKKLLDYDMVPVPYGDVCIDLKKGCTILSTEKILNYLSNSLKKLGEEYNVSRIIICTDVGGVFKGDPKINKNVEFIPKITPKNFQQIKQYLVGSLGIDVTGGMLHKVERMLDLAKLDIETEIIDATKSHLLKRSLLGEKGIGTIITKD
jgi:isopentenyl phosphate kinase